MLVVDKNKTINLAVIQDIVNKDNKITISFINGLSYSIDIDYWVNSILKQYKPVKDIKGILTTMLCEDLYEAMVSQDVPIFNIQIYVNRNSSNLVKEAFSSDFVPLYKYRKQHKITIEELENDALDKQQDHPYFLYIYSAELIKQIEKIEKEKVHPFLIRKTLKEEYKRDYNSLCLAIKNQIKQLAKEKNTFTENADILITKIRYYRNKLEYKVLDITDRANPVNLTTNFKHIGAVTTAGGVLLENHGTRKVNDRILKRVAITLEQYKQTELNFFIANKYLCKTNKKEHNTHNMVIYIIPQDTYSNYCKIIGITDDRAFDLVKLCDKADIVKEDRVNITNISKIHQHFYKLFGINKDKILFINN